MTIAGWVLFGFIIAMAFCIAFIISLDFYKSGKAISFIIAVGYLSYCSWQYALVLQLYC